MKRCILFSHFPWSPLSSILILVAVVVVVDGAVVAVPQGSVVIAPRQKYVLDSDGHPVADHRGRSITVDNDTIILQVGD